ncbi:MAG: sulfatase-like hydrolase/transferase [Planctomycetes bacterium]|nr:sulfatase-like hydrolase/transferase [Planctomycetota bacterium]
MACRTENHGVKRGKDPVVHETTAWRALAAAFGWVAIVPGSDSWRSGHTSRRPDARRRRGGRPSSRCYEESLGLFSSGGGETTLLEDDQGRPVTGYRGWMFQTDDRQLFPEQGVGLTPEIDARFANAAIEFIRRKPERPFFLHVNFTGPHDPLYWPPGMKESYDPAAIPLPENFLAEHPFDHGNFRGRDEELWPWPRTAAQVREGLALYYAVITYIDRQVGRITAALEETGQLDNTLIIFAGDHGLAIGSHGLRGKQNMYEHTVNVPLIVAGPGIPENRRSEAQVYLRDLYPTTCELAGVPIPETVEAASFAGVLRGEADSHHKYAYGYFRDSQRMIRGDRWKLIYYPHLDREQLFDLADDPHELHNLAADPQHSELKRDLRRRLAAWRREVGDPIAE